MTAVRVFLRAARAATTAPTGARGFLSDLSKKTQEAVEKTKAAAEELQQRAGSAAQSPAIEELKKQAAAASATFSQTVAQAQDLAKATASELLKNTPAAGASGSTSDNAHTEEQQQQSTGSTAAGGKDKQQQQQHNGEQQQSKPGVGERLRNVFSSALNEMRAAVLPEQPRSSALRGASAKAGEVQTATTTELMASPAAAESAWEKQWREMRDKLGGHPFFASVSGGLRGSRVYEAGREAAENLREKWETSDSPLVHRLQDAADAMFAEGEAARALREIRARDPSFDMVAFLQQLKMDVPSVIGAYLRGEEDVIREHCSAEMIERLTGIMRAQAAAGLVPDPTLLDTSEVELVDIKLLDNETPVVVAQFTCQQINCTRDGHGNVVEGAPDEVHRVYYYWALAQEDQGYVGTDGGYHPPRWRLREMLIRGMHALL